MSQTPTRNMGIERMMSRAVAYSLVCGAIGSAIVLVGVSFGCDFIKSKQPAGFIESLGRWDGQHYAHIIQTGYDYDPTRQSVVAFFPGYPLLAGALAWITGLATISALVVVANGCTLGAMALMSVYLRERELPSDAKGSGGGERGAGSRERGGTKNEPELDAPALIGKSKEQATQRGQAHFSAATAVAIRADNEPKNEPDPAVAPDPAQGYALLALALFPTTFFFRMAYSESLFLCIAIGCLLGIRRNWPLAAIALLAGLATAVRPTGVALILPIVWHVFKTSKSRGEILRRLSWSVPLACWGLAAFVAFQACAFGEPWAFIRTQEFWRFRPLAPASDKLWSLLSWEPIWGAYLHGSTDYWREPDGIANSLFSLAAANPIYFVGTAALIFWGGWKRWLTVPELLLSVPTLAIPYLARGYETCMASQGRFAAVVFPAYIVLGHLLTRLPATVAAALLVLSAFLMAVYAALFAAGYSFI